jgi:glycerol-3-phosphate dehydrogenase
VAQAQKSGGTAAYIDAEHSMDPMYAKKIGVDMPIIEQVYAILYEGKDPKQTVRELMTRELKVEVKH